jgi:hypothetical protein
MRHFLNDIEIAPRNLLDIGVVSDFTNRPDELSLNVDKLILPREALTIIQNHVNTIGVFEGIPYRVEMEPGIVLQYYVDLTEDAIYRDYEIEVKIKRRNAKDSFFERADGTSFELMRKKGVQFQFIDVPYVLIKDNQAEAGLSLTITIYVMTRETIQAIKDLAESIAALIEAITPNATVPPLPPAGSIISLSIKVAAQLAYTAALLLATIKMAQQMFEILFPKIRYYKACKVKELISKGCFYLGYSFQSNLLDGISGLTILPVPIVKEKRSIFDYLQNDLNFSFTKGYPTAQDSTPTLGSLISAIETQFNARTKVINGVVQLERRDYWQNLTPNQIFPALVIQDDRQDEYTLNTDAIWKRYYIHYQTDYSDLNTLDFYDPTDAEYSTEPANVVNADLVNIKGLNDVNISFALGVRKTRLTWLEQYAKFLFASIDEVTGVFGGGTNYAAQINNRIGVLKLSQQFFATSKMLYLIGDKQPANYANFLSAKAMWNNYHFINQIQLNDYQIRNEVRTRISNADFLTLLNNNYAEIGGDVCEILRLEYIDEKSETIITYRRPFDYANGKVTTLIINE